MSKRTKIVGLSDTEVLQSRREYGENILSLPDKETLWDKFKSCFHYWIVRILIIATVLSVITFSLTSQWLPSTVWAGTVILSVLLCVSLLVAFFGGLEDTLITILLYALIFSCGISFYEGVWIDANSFSSFFDPIGIAIAILLATGVGFFLERSNEKTFQSLNKVNDETLVKVIRNGYTRQIPRKEIVVNDIILLDTGEEIPADCELIKAFHLRINESALTGEPVCTKTTKQELFDTNATYPSNHILKGTVIVEGYCTARVYAVGDATECGKVFEAARVKEGDPTPLSQKLNSLAQLITRISYSIAALIVIGRMTIYFIQGGALDFHQTESIISFVRYLLSTIMIAVTLIVVAVPEGLPISVTLSLAFSMKRLMKQNTLPRTMHACETMGATSIICTDKTGTLTQNQMRIFDVYPHHIKDLITEDDERGLLLQEAIALNTTANLDLSNAEAPVVVGNPTEGALLLWMQEHKLSYLTIREKAELIDRIPFSTELKYMATVAFSNALQKRVVFLKGAPEIILRFSSLSPEQTLEYQNILSKYQHMAMRTLAFAYKIIEEHENPFKNERIGVENFTMLGFVAISDPIRPDVSSALQECINAGIQVKIITGDTSGTAIEIARQLGLWTNTDGEKNILRGSDLTDMKDEEVLSIINDVKIISRARPNDKERIVRLLRSQNHVVSVTGDGTNDAPALNAADVGLSMGDGTAVAKEASDMTILDNSFSTIANAVLWGRSLYKNIQRFLLFQMTINVVACLIVLIGAFIGTESPLTVTQMLWVNLIMDTFAALALASLPPSRSVMKENPRPINSSIISHSMAKQIFGIGLFFTSILLAILIFFQHNEITSLTHINFIWDSYNGLSPYELGLFFTIFVMLQFWNMFNAKAFMTGKSAFYKLSFKNTRWFLIIACIIFIGQIIIVQLGGKIFNIAKGGLLFSDWLIIITTTSLVLWVGELVRLHTHKNAN